MSAAGQGETKADEQDAEVTELSSDEWKAAVVKGLQRVGLTRAELQQQAQEKNFSSTEARKLWMIIGDED